MAQQGIEIGWPNIAPMAIRPEYTRVGNFSGKESGYMDDSHIIAHKHSIRHHGEVMASTLCGCFFCCKTFAPSDIKNWVADGATESDKTALCPYCGIDSVIGSASGYPITEKFLEMMKRHWF